MRMYRKNWKDRKGVSPVIATILMVAITVVLAAVLYVMVMGFGGDTGGQAPTVTTTKQSANERIVISINTPTDISQFKIGTEDFTSADTPKIRYTVSGVEGLTLVDAGGDGKINTGDYFEYESGETTTTIDLLWTSGDIKQVVATFTY